MKKTSRISQAPLNLKLSSSFLDFLLLITSTVILYFIVLYLVFGLGFNYTSKKEQISNIEQEHNLNLKQGLDYKEYEIVVKQFYNDYADNIVARRKQLYGDEMTVIQIYNTAVLKLPEKPDITNYKTNLFEYYQNEDGTFDVNRYALKIQGEGYNYDRYLSDLFYSAYSNLPNSLYEFDSNYKSLQDVTKEYEFISKLIAFSVSLIILFIIVPLSTKYKTTIFEHVFKLANVNLKDGYIAKNWRVIIKPIITYLLPLIGILAGGRNGIVILVMLPIFINYLILIFGKSNLEISELITRTVTISVPESLIFKNQNEENEFLNNANNQITDKEYLEQLKALDNIKIIDQNEANND